MKKWIIIAVLTLGVLYAGFKVFAWQVRSGKMFYTPIQEEVLGPYWIVGPKEEAATEEEFKKQLEADGIVRTVSASIFPGNDATSSEMLDGTTVTREVYNRLRKTGRYRVAQIKKQRCLVASRALPSFSSSSGILSKMLMAVSWGAGGGILIVHMERELRTRNLHVSRLVMLQDVKPISSSGGTMLYFAPLEEKD